MTRQGGTAFNVTSAWLSSMCLEAVNGTSGSKRLYGLLLNTCADFLWPGDRCVKTVVQCIHNSQGCAECIAGGTMSDRHSSTCKQITGPYQIEPTNGTTVMGVSCAGCPVSASYNAHNIFVVATAALGGASFVLCTWVAIVIIATGRSRVSLRDRIVVGLMIANAMFSVGSALPVNLWGMNTQCDVFPVLSFSLKSVARAFWFAGKFAGVGFELLIIGASIRSLSTGRPLEWWIEATLHGMCVCMGIVAGVIFAVKSLKTNNGGYNSVSFHAGYFGGYSLSYVSVSDDFDDDSAPAATAKLRFYSERNTYEELVQSMLQIWNGLLGVALFLWICLRIVYYRVSQRWRMQKRELAARELSDEWRETRRSEWRARAAALSAELEEYTEVSKPLGVYAVIFLIFAVPAVVMSTAWCQKNQEAHYSANWGPPTYGSCDISCEFALAFRAFAIVGVYSMPRERRVELLVVRLTLRKLFARVLECIRCTPTPYKLLDDDDCSEYEMDTLEESPTSDDNANSDSVGNPTAPAESWHIDESNITKLHLLGEGAYGGVWEGRLLPENEPVAIKILFAGAVDEDGDIIDFNADEDFRKECAALQRVNSPYLLKFFGFGNTKEGNGFLVTELLDGGSLEDALHDTDFNIPWQLRVKFGMHVALGMEHLHERQMLHRDLKAANVLLSSTQKQKCATLDWRASSGLFAGKSCGRRSPA